MDSERSLQFSEGRRAAPPVVGVVLLNEAQPRRQSVGEEDGARAAAALKSSPERAETVDLLDLIAAHEAEVTQAKTAVPPTRPWSRDDT